LLNLNNQPVKYRGAAFEYQNGQMLIVPPLSSRQLEEHAEEIDKCTTPGTFKLKEGGRFILGNVVPAVKAALSRNYPDISDDEVSDFVTVENWGQLVGAILGNIDKPKTRVGEPFPVGPLPSDLPTSIGAAPVVASPAPLDGPGITS
jgi:hypothetical protein